MMEGYGITWRQRPGVRRATAVQPSGAAALFFGRKEAHAILRPKSGRVANWLAEVNCGPEEPTFKRKRQVRVGSIALFRP
jgi:hypothetical protein